MPEARALPADIAVCSHNDSFGQFTRWTRADPVGTPVGNFSRIRETYGTDERTSHQT